MTPKLPIDECIGDQSRLPSHVACCCIDVVQMYRILTSITKNLTYNIKNVSISYLLCNRRTAPPVHNANVISTKFRRFVSPCVMIKTKVLRFFWKDWSMYTDNVCIDKPASVLFGKHHWWQTSFMAKYLHDKLPLLQSTVKTFTTSLLNDKFSFWQTSFWHSFFMANYFECKLLSWQTTFKPNVFMANYLCWQTSCMATFLNS